MWPLGLGLGMSLLGGILGGKGQRQPLNPALLRQLFGPEAIGRDTNDIYALLRNSPAFSAMMNSAALQGTRASNMTAANLASRGLSTTPYGGFLKAASRGYGGQLQRQGQSDLFMQALQAALSNVNQRQNLWGQSMLTQQQQPSFQSMLGSSLLAGGIPGILGFGK